MAQNSWPSPTYNTHAVTDAEYEHLMLRGWSGLRGNPTGSAVVYTTTGLQVFIRAANYAWHRGFLWYSGATDYTHAIASNSSGSTRIDRVVLQLDRTTWNVRSIIKTGTPGAGPPGLVTSPIGDTGTYEMPLAQVTIPNGAANVTVAREEQYFGSPVGVVGDANAVALNQATGHMQVDTLNSSVNVWFTSGKKTIWNDTGDVALTVAGNWSAAGGGCTARRIGNIVFLHINIARTINTLQSSDTSSQILAAIPSQFRPLTEQWFAVHTSGGASSTAGRLDVQTNGVVYLTHHHDDIAVGRTIGAGVTYFN